MSGLGDTQSLKNKAGESQLKRGVQRQEVKPLICLWCHTDTPNYATASHLCALDVSVLPVWMLSVSFQRFSSASDSESNRGRRKGDCVGVAVPSAQS